MQRVERAGNKTSGAFERLRDRSVQTGSAFEQLRDRSLGAGSSFEQLRSKALAAQGAFLGLAAAAASLIPVYRNIAQAQTMQASLETVTGSAENARIAFEGLLEVAEQTPFTLDQSINGFTRLVALGLTPSREALVSYGNTAASMNKTMMDMVEAVADATVGEFERLKEFGIRASAEGEKVAVTFRGQTEVIERTAGAIEEYLIQVGQENFAGSMARQMDTLSGQASNLGDAFNRLSIAIGDAGGESLAGSFISRLTYGIEMATLATQDLQERFGGSATALETLGEYGDRYLGAVADRILFVLDYAQTLRLGFNYVQQQVLELALAGVDSMDGISQSTIDVINGALQPLSEALGWVIDKFAGILEAASSLPGPLSDDFARAAEAARGFGESVDFTVSREGVDQLRESISRMVDENAAELEELKNSNPAESIKQWWTELQDGSQESSKALSEFDEMVERITKLLGGNGNSGDSLSGELKESAKEAKQFASEAQSLADALYPVVASQREYAESQALIKRIAQEMPWLIDSEADALQRLAESYENAGDWAEEYGLAVGGSAKKAEDAFVSLEDVAVESIGRVGEQYSDMLTDLLTGTEVTMEDVGRVFARGLAEMATQATLNPILVGIQGSMTGQTGPNGEATFSNGLNQAASNVTSMFGGNSVGTGFAKAGGYMSDKTGMGNVFANAGSVPNWQYGAAGILGGVGAGAIFDGQYSSALGGVGSSLGMAAGSTYLSSLGWAAGPVGAVAGMLLGGAMGEISDSLFGSDRKSYGQIGSFAGMPDGDDVYGEDGRYEGMLQQSALGYVGVTAKQKTDDDALVDMVSSFVQIDNQLASVMTAAQLEKTQEALDGWRSDKTKNIGSIVDDRLSAVVEATDSIFADALSGLSNENLVKGLIGGLQVENVGAQMAEAVAADMNAEFRDALGSGSHIEAATQAILSSAQAVTLLGDSVDRLGLQFDATASGALNAAGGLAELVGGVQNLSSLQSQYYETFYSEQERFANLQSDLSATFSDMGYALPDTASGVRSIVEGLDLMTEAGQEQYATILQLVPSLEQYISGMQEQRTAAQEAAEAAQQQAQAQREAVAASVLGVVQSAYGALEQAVSAEQGMLRDAYEATTESIQDNIVRINDAMQTTEQLSRSLGNTLSSLRGLSSESSMAAYSSAQDYLRSVVASGGLGDQERMDSALSVVSQQSTDLYSSFTDYQRDLYTTSGLIADLKDRADNQLDSQEESVLALERQMRQAEEQYRGEVSRLDDMLANQAAQLEAELGQQSWLETLNGSILTIPDALAALAGALGTALATDGTKTNPVNSSNTTDYLAAKAAQLNTIGYEGRTDWTVDQVNAAFAEAGLSASEHYAKWGKDENIPGFASGGLHTGGWRLVGEQGPELEYTPPSRIYSASQTSSMLDMGGVVAELKALRKDNEYLRNALYQIAKNTGQSTKQLQRWDGEGMPKERDFA
ncbi:hypothetical protein MHM84_03800 [Halomonas sp. McH1-25]|uniref:hypothetical protein n=1 Tax=unclassified Halomonas TaxID=2609666 RepID=UPI001EF648CE|nr:MULTISPECIES: hypothetical protein [unclassified Halomonas]MCG7598897.1 hypothetical protein [Halomonas sp. McH1-25]MCP1340860.1 hypothetical protein [Halomonas sp. FL8]MCP1361257.1 hypothetical protein [Halomonas sp. BBD45]